MEKQIPIGLPCARCGKQPRFISSVLEPRSGRLFHMFECECGEKSWISESSHKDRI
jgi:hypothetical protein